MSATSRAHRGSRPLAHRRSGGKCRAKSVSSAPAWPAARAFEQTVGRVGGRCRPKRRGIGLAVGFGHATALSGNVCSIRRLARCAAERRSGVSGPWRAGCHPFLGRGPCGEVLFCLVQFLSLAFLCAGCESRISPDSDFRARDAWSAVCSCYGRSFGDIIRDWLQRTSTPAANQQLWAQVGPPPGVSGSFSYPFTRRPIRRGDTHSANYPQATLRSCTLAVVTPPTTSSCAQRVCNLAPVPAISTWRSRREPIHNPRPLSAPS